MLALQETAVQWTERAVHDTVAAVAQQAQFQRTLSDTLWRKFWRAFTRAIGEFFDLFQDSPVGRNVVLVLFGVLLVLIVARIWMSERAQAVARTGGDSDVARARGADAWAEAERLAAAGLYTAAAHSLFAALLAACAARGELRLHPSKTTGDYARELRRRDAASQRGFQLFRSRYDRIIYGELECSASDYALLLGDARPLLAREKAA